MRLYLPYNPWFILDLGSAIIQYPPSRFSSPPRPPSSPHPVPSFSFTPSPFFPPLTLFLPTLTPCFYKPSFYTRFSRTMYITQRGEEKKKKYLKFFQVSHIRSFTQDYKKVDKINCSAFNSIIYFINKKNAKPDFSLKYTYNIFLITPAIAAVC